MLVSEYDDFVRSTDQFEGLPKSSRKKIAIYGLASEIGSVGSAIKKKLLKEDRSPTESVPSAEIQEELGDAMWYCFALARVVNDRKPMNIMLHDIANLKSELSAGDARSEKIRGVIGPENHQEFLAAAESFPRSSRSMTFNDYQSVAYLTARTASRVLVDVCVAVLYQLSAEVFRILLPEIERELNTSLDERPINDILGEIAWHLAAIASTYNLDLGEIAKANMEKVSFRRNRSHPVIVHDFGFPPEQRFPRQFEVAFVTLGKGYSRMYFDGRRLGDQLTDNSYDDDGYRFHDVLHLANIAHLGWSPVVRGLMGRKRKSNEKTDEVEDGARAKIVEEAVVKAIHAEGQRLIGPSTLNGPFPLFADKDDISFKFLKLLRSFVEGLEVSKNRFWEWEGAIVEGCAAYHQLRLHGQGTVTLDLDERSLKYEPHVYIALSGQVVGFGTASARITSSRDSSNGSQDRRRLARIDAKRLAILAALGFDAPTEDELMSLRLTERGGDEISVQASGSVKEAMWAKKVVVFRATALELHEHWVCSALALSDP